MTPPGALGFTALGITTEFAQFEFLMLSST